MTEESSRISTNPAIARCWNAWLRAYHEELEKGKHRVFAAEGAGLAYRKAMPPLAGEENIRDFIACVAHGILCEAIEGPTGPRLLYAAQVALTAFRRQPSPPKAEGA